MATDKKQVFLTFDDGPTPEITNWVLDTLSKYNAKASFFCLGSNIEKHPEIFKRIITEKHTVGNHGFHHLNGWQTDDQEYLSNIFKSDQLMDSLLFRPPYGKLKPSQTKQIIQDFQIVMWDVMSGDFDENMNPVSCFKNVIKKTEPGSIIVFHDNKKAERNLKYVLPKLLKYYSKLGYEFSALPKKPRALISLKKSA